MSKKFKYNQRYDLMPNILGNRSISSTTLNNITLTSLITIISIIESIKQSFKEPSILNNHLTSIFNLTFYIPMIYLPR